MQAFDTNRKAAKPRRITGGGKRSAVGTSAAPVSSNINVRCALPWSEAERQGASMAISR